MTDKVVDSIILDSLRGAALSHHLSALLALCVTGDAIPKRDVIS